MQVIINDLIVHYTDSGGVTNKPVLICIHGWMHNTSSFNELTQELSDTYRCVALDLPSFGKSSADDTVTTIADFARLIAKFIKKLSIQDYIIVGHSMGGQIALYGAGSGILKPQKLVLIGAAGIRDDRKAYKVFLQVVSKMIGWVLPTAVKLRVYERLGSDYRPDLSDIHKEIIKQTLQTDVRLQSENITVPTLFIYGENDTFTPPHFGTLFQEKVRNSKQYLISAADHWPHQKRSGEVAEIMKEFLAS
jgi:pimeloyl-ACP methyl ester carboxylesterase